MQSCFSRVRLFAALWTARLLCPLDSPGKDTGVSAMPSSKGSSDSGVKPTPLMSLVLVGRFFTTSATWEAPYHTSVLPFSYFNHLLLLGIVMKKINKGQMFNIPLHLIFTCASVTTLCAFPDIYSELRKTKFVDSN